MKVDCVIRDEGDEPKFLETFREALEGWQRGWPRMGVPLGFTLPRTGVSIRVGRLVPGSLRIEGTKLIGTVDIQRIVGGLE